MKITINLDEEKNQMETNIDKPVRIDDLMTIFFTLQLDLMNNFIKQMSDSGAPEEHIKAIKEDLYDKYNAGASNLLYLFIPDKELRPDLTVEAMKEAEDRYMYNQLNRKSRREVDKKTKGESKILRFPDNHIPHVD